jgi:hypothetical protein
MKILHSLQQRPSVLIRVRLHRRGRRVTFRLCNFGMRAFRHDVHPKQSEDSGLVGNSQPYPCITATRGNTSETVLAFEWGQFSLPVQSYLFFTHLLASTTGACHSDVFDWYQDGRTRNGCDSARVIDGYVP